MRAHPALILALAFILAMPAAALAAAPDKAEKAAAKMLNFGKSLETAGTQIETTLAAMNALAEAKGEDLAAKFKTFSKEVDTLDKMAAKAKSNAEAAASQREAYLAQWKETAEKIQNQELKAAAEARRGELQPKIDEIKSALTSARETFTPFMQDLKDLTLFLGNSLNPSGVASAATLMTKCNESGAKVKSDIDRGVAGVRDLAASIQPGGVAKS